MDDARRLPATQATPATLCDGCGASIIWAVTVAGPNGRGGKLIPLDPHEDQDGNVAVRPMHAGRLVARVLGKDDDADRPSEYLAMTHFASCPANCHPSLPPAASTAPSTGRRRTRPRR